jgi:hypothetical protein
MSTSTSFDALTGSVTEPVKENKGLDFDALVAAELDNQQPQPDKPVSIDFDALVDKELGNEEVKKEDGVLSLSGLDPSEFAGKIRGEIPWSESEQRNIQQLEIGVKEAVTPFGLGDIYKDPNLQPKTIGEMAYRVVGNLGPTIAISAVTGGTVVVPRLATAAYAVYQGIGREYSESSARDESFSTLRAGVNVLTETASFATGTSRAAHVLTVGAMNAIQGAQYAPEGEAIAQGAVQGGIAGALTGAVPGLRAVAGKAKSVIKPKKVADEVVDGLAVDKFSKELASEKADEIAAIQSTAYDTAPEVRETLSKVLAKDENSLKIESTARDLMEAGAREDALIYKNLTFEPLTEVEFRMTIYNPNKKEWDDALQARGVLDKAKDDNEKGFLAFSYWQGERLALAEHLTRNTNRRYENVTQMYESAARIMKTKPEDFIEQRLKTAGELYDKVHKDVVWSAWKKAYYDSKAMELVLKKDPISRKMAELSESGIEGTGWKFAEIRGAAQVLDQKTGRQWAYKIDNYAKAQTRLSHGRLALKTDLKAIEDQAKSAGITREELRVILKDPEDPRNAEVPLARKLFDRLHKFASENGMTPKYKEGFSPDIMMTPVKATQTIKAAYKRHGTEAILKAEPFKKIKSGVKVGELEEVDQLHYILSRQLNGRLKTPADVAHAIKLLSEGIRARSALGKDANAMFANKQAIPKLLLEKDFIESAYSYGSNLMESVILDPAMRQLELEVPVIRFLNKNVPGDKYKEALTILTKYVEDMAGLTSGSNAQTMRTAKRIRIWAEDKLLESDKNLVQRFGYNTAKYAPDILSIAMSNVYTNLLGWRLTPVLKNAVQPIQYLAPELGGAYGFKKMMRGYYEAARAMTKGTSLSEEIRKRGLSIAGHKDEAYSIVRDSINEVAKIKNIDVLEKLDQYSNAAMYLFSQAEVLNRYVSMKATDSLIDDLVKGVPEAMRYIKGIESGTLLELESLFNAGRMERFRQVLINYVDGQTMFKYGAVAQSHYGRAMSPIIMMLTKFPTATLTNWSVDIKRYGWSTGGKRVLEKMLAPLAILLPMYEVLTANGESDTGKALLGSNIFSWTSLSSLQLGAPPAVGFVARDVPLAIRSMMEGEFEKAFEVIGRSASTFIPFGGAPAAYKHYESILSDL